MTVVLLPPAAHRRDIRRRRCRRRQTSAHECYVANRSDAGNAGASHSANWYTLKLSDLFADAHNFLGGDALTADQLQLALDMAAEQGLPSSFTLFERFTLPRSSAELAALSSKSADGKGIDHFFVKYGEQTARG